MAVSARLAGIGNQGVGALEFEPETSNPKESCRHDSCNTIDLDAVADGIRAVQADEATDTELDELIRLSGYAGGARPKIVCLVSDDKRLVKPGNAPRPNGAPWIIKFSNLTDPEDSGALEYAVSLLAKSADIDICSSLQKAQDGSAFADSIVLLPERCTWQLQPGCCIAIFGSLVLTIRH